MALQMSWQPILKRKTGPPLGLKNLGNTCYLNSVLQCLTYTPPLANFCLNKQHSSSCDSAAERDRKIDCPFCILEKRIARSLSCDLALDTPSKINSCLRIFAEHFRFGRQEDAHEFLRYVIDACHNTALRLKKLQLQQQRRKVGIGEDFGGSTVVKEIFGGALQSQVKCLACGAESNKVDEIMDISLDVLHSGSVKESMQKFFQPEVLDGNNKYKCDNCKKLVAARKQMSILRPPNVLVIQLKRFEGIYGGKIDKAIAFEDVLLLSSYMCKANKDPHPEYNLFATIVHSGFSQDSGHYYAYIKDAMGRWYCCNDSYVSLSTLQEVLSEKVYILFFSRTKQRPVPAKTAVATNGTKSYDCNGSNTFKISKAGNQIKPVNAKQFVDHTSEKDNSTTSKVNEVPLSVKTKVSSFGSSGTKLFSTNGNTFAPKKEFVEKNEDAKASIRVEKSEDQLLSFKDSNGVSKHKPVDAVTGEKSQLRPLANGNGKIQRIDVSLANGNGKNQSINANSSGAERCEENGARNIIPSGRGPDYQGLQNGSGNGLSDKSVSRRKIQEAGWSILCAEDARSRAKVEELKETLRKEASLVLGSCGWSDEVYTFMRSKKKVCVREAGNDASKDNDIKALLIAEAKSTFISRIPESLKGNFIGRLKSFSEEKP